MQIPSLILKQLYNFNSLKNVEGGIKFALKNRLSDAKLTKLSGVKIAGQAIGLELISIRIGEASIKAENISTAAPLDFPLKGSVEIFCAVSHLVAGKYELEIAVESEPFGALVLKIEDGISTENKERVSIPRNKDDDYSPEAIQARLDFVKDFTGVEIEHINKYSFDPRGTKGNCEHFIGVAQIPMGIAGPVLINGEYAKGDFLIPMATSEGTLVASYNRGMKVINLCGGATCTVQRDAMQRAPVFEFDNARQARDFVDWIKANFKQIAVEAESTSSVARLQYIDPYLSNKFAFLRFNYSTGDAAGQNMVGRATFAACSWIMEKYTENPIRHFYLESNFATDKKASQVNIMRTRGKRVTAEIVFKREVLQQQMRVTPEALAHHYGISNIGSLMSGANNNGLHSANAITAMFIATGQDVANVAESSAGLVYAEVTKEGDLYFSITIPSLIIATYGGGVGLSTQNEALKMLGCAGRDKVNKLAEIIVGVVLAGEISLASAISSSDWVSSHEKYGRNR